MTHELPQLMSLGRTNVATLEPTIEQSDGAGVTPAAAGLLEGAIFAGAAIATAVTVVLLGLLGVAIGATISDPMSGDTPSAKAFGIGAGLWWIVDGVLALLAGGWAAARMAGLRRRERARCMGWSPGRSRQSRSWCS